MVLDLDIIVIHLDLYYNSSMVIELIITNKQVKVNVHENQALSNKTIHAKLDHPRRIIIYMVGCFHKI